jgi:hypothetical protein
MIPSYPIHGPLMYPQSRNASKKNRMNNDPKMNWRPLFFFKVPRNMQKVNNPHMKKYHAINPASVAPALGPALMNVKLGKSHNATKEIQNNPYEVNAVVPNVLPFRNSKIPAMICANPP